MGLHDKRRDSMCKVTGRKASLRLQRFIKVFGVFPQLRRGFGLGTECYHEASSMPRCSLLDLIEGADKQYLVANRYLRLAYSVTEAEHL